MCEEDVEDRAEWKLMDLKKLEEKVKYMNTI